MESPIYERVKMLCEINGTSITTLCVKLTRSKGNLSTWKKGIIKIEHLSHISEMYDVTTDWIISGKEKCPAGIVVAEHLRSVFRNKAGREPTQAEFLKIDEFINTFIKGMND